MNLERNFHHDIFTENIRWFPKPRIEPIKRSDRNNLKFSNKLIVNEGNIQKILQTNDVSLLKLHGLHKQKRSPHEEQI